MRRIAHLLKVLALGLLLLGSSAVAQRLTMAQVSNPVTLDPNRTFNGLSFSITNQVYENLVYFGTDGVIQPRLAESWEFTQPNVLELKIREGVTFHDGTPLDAAAVVASLEHFLDPEATNPGRFVLSRLSDVRATGDYTVELVTETPFAPLLAHLAHPVAAIVQAGLGESLDRNPVGTGPFRFVSWEQDAQVVLEANPDYWGGEPAIKEIVVRIIPDVSTILVELRSGGVDAFYGIPADSFGSIANASGLEAQRFLGWGSNYVGFNLENPKLQDVRVRQAIAHVIDKELIGEIVNGLPAVAAIPPTVAYAAEDLVEPYPYDPERARELLAEAGVSDLSLRIDVYTDPTLETIAQILQAELADIGVNLEIRTQPYSAYAEAVLEDSLELYASGWGTVTLDADYALYGFLHPSERGGGSNTSNYVDDHVTELLEEGRNNPDTDARAAAYHEVQEIILEDLPFVTVNYPLSTFAKTSALQGEKVNFSVINLDLREATLNR